jgi:hypothetical protein
MTEEAQEHFITVQQEMEITPFQRVMHSIASSVDGGKGRTLDHASLEILFEGYVQMARELAALSAPVVEAEPTTKKRWRL